MLPEPAELFRKGRLRDAIAAQQELVRAAPADVARRWFLVELLCFAEEWERADRLLDVIASQAPEMALTVLEFRQLLRGEGTRRHVMNEGRAPHIIGPTGESLYPVVGALLSLRNGALSEAEGKIADVAATTSAVSGVRNGEQRFDEFRDLDDVCASFLEFITESGEYHWVSVTDLAMIETQQLSRPRDLIWRRAKLEIKDGTAGEVYLPALYVSEGRDKEDDLRLCRRTEWIEDQGAPVRGIGLRMFLVGVDDVPIHELGHVEFRRNDRAG
jgi:type VI secretion system protein ImpE